jgi:hypothetical protein
MANPRTGSSALLDEAACLNQDDGAEQVFCALPACGRGVKQRPGQMRRRYCSAEHRAEHRVQRHSTSPRGRSPQMPCPPTNAAALFGEEAAEQPMPAQKSPLASADLPKAEGTALADLAGQAAATLVRRQHSTSTRHRRVRAFTFVAIGGLVLSTVTMLPRLTEGASAPTPPAGVGATNLDQWAGVARQRVSVLTTEINELSQVEAEWNAQPTSQRYPVPEAVVELRSRQAIITQQQTLLLSVLEQVHTLHQADLDLTALTVGGASIDEALDRTPQHGILTPDQVEARERLRRQRRENAGQRELKRDQLNQLRGIVTSAMRIPLPETSTSTKATVEAVRDYLRHPERPRSPLQPQRASITMLEVITSRKKADPNRTDVHSGAPPKPGRESASGPEHTSVRAQFTADANDKVGDIAQALGCTFAELNAVNGNRFSGITQPLGGQQITPPSNWDGVWIAQPGDSYWRIYVSRFNDPAGYRKAMSRDASPHLIELGSKHRVRVGQEYSQGDRGGHYMGRGR